MTEAACEHEKADKQEGQAASGEMACDLGNHWKL